MSDTQENFVACGCGRSPTGKCCGWHSLTEEEYQEKLDEYLLENLRDVGQDGP